MAILLQSDMKVLVQYATSNYAKGMIAVMQDAGTSVVAGVAVGHGGSVYNELAMFDLVSEAVATTGASVSVCFAPPPRVADAIFEAVDAGIKLVMVAAEFVPVNDLISALAYARENGCWIVGPNSAGMLNPGIGALGGYPAAIGMPGKVAVISRSGTVSLVLCATLTRAGIGQSSIVSIGGDTVIGRNPDEYVRLLNDDPQTDVIVLVGEIGGVKEYGVVRLLPSLNKPLVAFVGGRYAPPGRRFGHAGALVSGDAESAARKLDALRGAGAHVVKTPSELVDVVRPLISSAGKVRARV